MKNRIVNNTKIQIEVPNASFSFKNVENVGQMLDVVLWQNYLKV